MSIINDINEINEINAKIQELETDLSKIKKKVNSLSRYDVELIGSILVKLMEQFEGIEYECNERLYYNEYNICPQKTYGNEFVNVYSRFSIHFNKYDHNPDTCFPCFLFPLSYMNDILYATNIFIPKYVQKFIDYLYEERDKNNLYDINEEQLELILNDFINKYPNMIIERQKEIKLAIEENIQKQKKEELKKSCIIDRKLIFNSICYIINHYEDNLTATTKISTEESNSYSWITIKDYDNLIISDGFRQFKFSSLTNTDGCYPDERYCMYHVNLNEDTNIYFFELKEEISDIIKDNYYIKYFMDKIEDEFYNSKNVSYEFIKNLLVDVSNKRKEKKILESSKKLLVKI